MTKFKKVLLGIIGAGVLFFIASMVQGVSPTKQEFGGTATSTKFNTGQIIYQDANGYAGATIINGTNIVVTTSTPGQLTFSTTGLQPAGNYILDTYASSTFSTYSYGSSTYQTLANSPTYAYASSAYATLWNLKPGTNVTISTSSGVTINGSSDSYMRGLFSASSPITYNNGTGAIGFDGTGYVSNTYASSTFVRQVTGSGNIASSGGLTPNITFTGVLPIANGGTATSTAPSDNAVFVGNGTTFFQSVIPSCSNATNSKLLYDNSLRVFTCGTDQSGGGGSLSGGITGYVGVWASSTSMTTGILKDNGTVAGVNATSSSYTFNIQAGANTNPFNVASSSGTSLLSVDTVGNMTGAGSLTLPNQINFNGAWTQFQATAAGTNLNFKTAAGTGDIIFTPNAIDTFWINDNQSVGINTSTTGSALFVQGKSTLIPLTVASSTGTTLFSIGQNGSTTLSSLGTGIVRSSSGSLYTDTTAYLSTIGSGAIGFNATWNGTNTLTQGKLIDNGTVLGMNATSSTIGFNIQGTGGTNDIFNVASSSTSSYLIVKASGNVGINTSTPGAQLVIQNAAGSTDIMRFSSSTGATLALIDSQGHLQIGTTTGTSLISVVGTAGSSSDLLTVASSTGTLGMKILSGGSYYSMAISSTTISTITYTIDLSAGNVQSFVLGTSTTLTINNIKPGLRGILNIQQDSTGSRTITWPSSFHWPAGTAPTLTTTANKVDVITFECYSSTVCFTGSNLNYAP